MDIVDIASKNETEARERALANRKNTLGVSTTYCRICDELIPEARRKAIITDLCVDCAAIEEKRNK